MLTNRCLAEGGAHVEKTHVKLVLNCATACAACIDFKSRDSDHHAHYCKACADSCEQVGDMDKCVQCCRKCEETRAAMAA